MPGRPNDEFEDSDGSPTLVYPLPSPVCLIWPLLPQVFPGNKLRLFFSPKYKTSAVDSGLLEANYDQSYIGKGRWPRGDFTASAIPCDIFRALGAPSAAARAEAPRTAGGEVVLEDAVHTSRVEVVGEADVPVRARAVRLGG